jgi:ankyrin repeat protein
MPFKSLANRIFFKEGQGYQDLSEADQKQARAINAENAGDYLSGFDFNSPPLLRYILTNYRPSLSEDGFMQITQKAIRGSAAYTSHTTVLDILLEDKKPPFDREDFIECFKAAVEKDALPAWRLLKECYATVFPLNNMDEYLVAMATGKSSNRMVREILETAAPATSNVYYRALEAALNEPYIFKTITTFSGKFMKDQKLLDDVFIAAVKKNRTDEAKYLLTQGADVNARKGIALTYAADNKNIAFFTYLLKQNIDSAQAKPAVSTLNTLFTIAADKKMVDDAKLLLELGADVNADKGIALYYALRNNDTVFFNFLMTQNIAPQQWGQKRLDDIFVAMTDKNIVNHVPLFVEQGADINANNGIALYYAVWHKNAEFLDFLMSHNFDIEKYGHKRLTEAKKASTYSAEFAKPLQTAINKIEAKAAQVETDRKRYALPRSDILSDTLLLPSGTTITTLFNFESRQQLIITESKTGISTVVTDFDDIKNPALIDKSLEKLRERGGVADNDWMHKGGAKKTTLDKD